MSGKRKKSARRKDLTAEFLAGALEEDRLEAQQRFSERSTGAQQRKIERTALLRAAEQPAEGSGEDLPVGKVVQVYSLFYDVEHEGKLRLCVARKTLNKLLETPIVVGDLVRFRETGAVGERVRPEAVIEQVLPRRTVLMRANSFNPAEVAPIVANAEQMLIVASLLEPPVKWGLVDRMIVAARSGGLAPVICLNKVDLRHGSPGAEDAFDSAEEAMGHYRSLGIVAIQTSATARTGLDELREVLRNKDSVLAGHSGVGKSSLIRALQPTLDIRIGAISSYSGKGIHTTTSSRAHELDFGGRVIDTPGVKHFGLWGVTSENLIEHFPDVEESVAPSWRQESYQRILHSLTVEE